MAKKVAIIGAGPGGLPAGMLRAHRGCRVEDFVTNGQMDGGTHPGRGLPIIFQSGRIAAEMIGNMV